MSDALLTVRGRRELTLQPGSITLLLGPNGAGKTHWLEQLAGLRDPDGADIRYGAEPLWLPGKRRPSRLGRQALLSYAYAAQSPEEQLFARTAEEELRGVLAPYRLTAAEQDERIRFALAAVGWNDGWRSRGPFRMSGGEKRRQALACLLATPARWLLLDEPTAGLDAAAQHLLAERLREKRAEGCGVLVVSHDSEWALKLADRVLLLSAAGELRELARDELLAEPRHWAWAGLPLPAWLSAAGALVRAGLAPALALDPAAAAAEWARLEQAAAGRREAREAACAAEAPAADALAVEVRGASAAPCEPDTVGRGPRPTLSEYDVAGGQPNETISSARVVGGQANETTSSERVVGGQANETASSKRVVGGQANETTSSERVVGGQAKETASSGRDAGRQANETVSSKRVVGGQAKENASSERDAGRRAKEATARERAGAGQVRGPLASLDPRAVWLSDVLLSLAIFSLRDWIGVGAAAIIVGIALALGRVSLRPWRALLIGFATFSLLVSALAGIGWKGAFHTDTFWLSLHSMVRTFLVMLLGLGLAMAITALRLKRSLEQLLSVRGTLPVLAQKIVLTVTLLVRFIPVFLSEWQRFARYAIARDKETSRSAGSVLRRIKGTAVPFLLGLFRMGEQVAFALESRGVGRRKTPVLARTERWRRRDSALVLVSAVVAGLLWRFFS